MASEFKGPDVKAPRFRQKALMITGKDFFKKFREKYPRYNNLSDTLIKQIIKRFNETIWENVIETRDGVQFPESIGMLFIATCESARGKNIDYGKSKKYGVSVSNKNWETDGKLAKIFYSSYASKYKFLFRECWSFTACRNFKRSVAKTYPDNWTMYVQIDPDKKLRKTYTAQSIHHLRKKKEQYQLNNYNEFDL